MKNSKTDLIARTVVWIAALVSFQSCARMSMPSKPETPDRIAVEKLEQAMDRQEKAVQTIVSSGKVSSGEWDVGTELNALVVGTLDPFRIKIEITHPWGRPLLHILMTESTIKILSFSEKKFYLGETGKRGTFTIFKIPIDPAIIWSFVRAYPVLLPHVEIKGTTSNQIILVNSKKENIQTVAFYPKYAYPRSSFFVKTNTELFFSDYEETGSIIFARKITVNNPRDKTRLMFVSDRTTLNKAVPDEIFEMEAPEHFQTIPLEEERTSAERPPNASETP